MLIVTGVGLCIFIFATGYMHGETGFYRFFAYMGLFMFSMLILVMGSNFLMMFVGWEGVGLCSYLLIGYYFDRKEAGDASRKAFITNRIGRSEEHTSELQSLAYLVCRLLLEKK